MTVEGTAAVRKSVKTESRGYFEFVFTRTKILFSLKQKHMLKFFFLNNNILISI